MTRQELIDELTALKEPDRSIDQAIAELFQYRRETKNIPLQVATPGTNVVTWYDPNGKEVTSLPKFTGSIDAAKSLFDLSFPHLPGGFSFHQGYAQAKVGDREAVKAFNIPAALCLATIKAARL
ncbi:hypothetical protein CN059_31920 [Sinorhizobium medicae]|uniref:Uncharacterized protein n=1 Tax=Sinorhizobium medicae TaxID=110321 RepID=A0ABX4TTL9_9HYPH|nr:hypothetical protein [Sinorhizobium medicae]MDX0716634.1 hypothetical protein [Sinorhizobium medicae]MDX0845093.1 hypothetical protein [Sinorhizobium medicae]MDX1060490.1 hypothetical protein [Sinorhizobium medicae]PLU09778.1 hypothetical protein BMJ33_00465 [Sinorhizobium medicae]PLU16609.1 hypothetical protein BMJ29_23000 [Sinorhizobium medicae]